MESDKSWQFMHIVASLFFIKPTDMIANTIMADL